MGFLDKALANIGIHTEGRDEQVNVARLAKLPEDHPVVAVAELAATRGMSLSDADLHRFFGDQTSVDSIVPIPRPDTPARYNWVARRTVDQLTPRSDDVHVDKRLPIEVRKEIAAISASMIDPLSGDGASLRSMHVSNEEAISARLVGYLQADSDSIARRSVDMLSEASDAGLRAEFELVPGTVRMRIPQDDRGRDAWIAERARTEHAMARAGVLPASGMIDAASRIDMTADAPTKAPLMESYVHPDILHDARMSLPEARDFTDIDLRFRFKELGGMGNVEIPAEEKRDEWLMSMLVEERQSQLLSGEQRLGLQSERRSIEQSIPAPSKSIQDQMKDPDRRRQISATLAFGIKNVVGL